MPTLSDPARLMGQADLMLKKLYPYVHALTLLEWDQVHLIPWFYPPREGTVSPRALTTRVALETGRAGARS